MKKFLTYTLLGVLLAGWFQRDMEERFIGLASEGEEQRKP